MPYKNKADQAASARRHYELNKDKMKARAIAHKNKMREVIKAFLDEKKSVPCLDCDKTYPPYVMHFDHVKGIKLFNISDGLSKGYSLSKIKDEVEKCEVVCANCHAERTWSRMQ